MNHLSFIEHQGIFQDFEDLVGKSAIQSMKSDGIRSSIMDGMCEYA